MLPPRGEPAVQYDETKLVYWKRREAEERILAGHTSGDAFWSHSALADSYAALIVQATADDLKASLH